MNETHLSKDNLYNLFKYLDAFNQGFLTKDSFIKTFQRSGRDIGEQEVAEMLKELNIDPEA